MASNKDSSEQLRERIRILERKFYIAEKNEVLCCGITMSQWHALVEIGRTDDISLNKLALLLNLDNSTMSRTVNGLVTTELVKREIDPSDRRYITLSLTDSVIKLFDRIEGGMDVYFIKFIA